MGWQVTRIMLVAAAACAAGSGTAVAQRLAEPAVPVTAAQERPAEALAIGASGAGWRATPLARRPWVRPVASLVVPGSGQLLGGQDRGLAYLAAEVWLVARAAVLKDQSRRDRAMFQELAYRVARARFTTARVDGSFEYYESMTHFAESGQYDADPGPAFLPEQDAGTFNGSVWLLARRTFFAVPDSLPPVGSSPYQLALAFYQSRAVGGEFQWSWRGASLEQDVFRGAIRSSDDAFRSATNYLGAVVVNHLVSAIDAFISVRAPGRGQAVPHIGVQPASGTVQLFWTVR